MIIFEGEVLQMRPKKVFFGYLILWVICAIMFLLSFVGQDTNFVLLITSLVVMFVGYIAFIFLYRCPHCDRLLLNRVAPWHYCPYCGNHLDAEPSHEYDYLDEDKNDESEKRSDGLKIQ